MNISMAPMEKVPMMQEPMHNVDRDENSKKESKGNTRNQITVQQKYRMLLMGSSVNWTKPRKESVSLKVV